MAIIMDYISEGGARILVNDKALDNSPENRERVYRNLSEIITRIEMRRIEEEIMEEERTWKKGSRKERRNESKIQTLLY